MCVLKNKNKCIVIIYKMRDYDREIYELEVIKERQETELIYQMRIIGK